LNLGPSYPGRADREVYLVDGVRTAQGRYGGALAEVRPDDLAGLVVQEVVRRGRTGAVAQQADSPIDELIVGAANGAWPTRPRGLSSIY